MVEEGLRVSTHRRFHTTVLPVESQLYGLQITHYPEDALNPQSLFKYWFPRGEQQVMVLPHTLFTFFLLLLSIPFPKNV